MTVHRCDHELADSYGIFSCLSKLQKNVLYSVSYTVYLVQCILYSVSYTVYLVQCILYSVSYTVYNQIISYLISAYDAFLNKPSPCMLKVK
jgi:hypothetical protein